MSLLQRLSRAIDTLSHVDLDDRAKVGALGEQYASRIIAEEDGSIWIANPIIPHPTQPGRVREEDFLVYTRGNLFCIEIKNYRGRISYPPVYQPMQIEQRNFLGKAPVTQSVLSGYDTSQIVQEKLGNYGEAIFRKVYPNPLTKTKNFISHLKRYVGQSEPRFQRLYIIPVACFSELADISAIHNPEAGIIYISELPTFFEQHTNPNPKFVNRPSQWLMQIMQKIPTWDLVQTTNHTLMNGILAEQALTFKRRNGQIQQLLYKTIRSIQWQRNNNLFSAYDTMQVTYMNGSSETLDCAGGELVLNRIKDQHIEQQRHKLRNLNTLVVGVANKFM